MKQNFRFTISYDGTRYYGWEHQPGNDMTIQGKLEIVLSIMTDSDVEVLGAGRTDAGVHAKEMTANAFLDTKMTEEEIFDYMNRYLPDDIAILKVTKAGDRFHSRYNATGKTYMYTCYYDKVKPIFDRKYVYSLDEKPDITLMKKAAAILIGEHDFKSFCSNPKMKKSTVRNVDSIKIEEEGPYIRFIFHGSGFLQHMVRILTGTLLEVGYGKRTVDNMHELLECLDRSKAGPTAPAQGLCMIKVDYN